MLSNRLLLVCREFKIVRCYASKASILRKKNSNKSQPKEVAFPPAFGSKLKRWPRLIQLELDEYLKQLDNKNNEKGITVNSADLDYIDYHVDPFNGHVIEFKFIDDDPRLRTSFVKGMPVILLERGEQVKKYESVIIDTNPVGFFVKLRGKHGKIFSPIDANNCKYTIMPSEEFGTYQLLLEFLEEQHKWKNLPGYPILQQVYRAKPMKLIHNDRSLKYYLVRSIFIYKSSIIKVFRI